MSSPCKILLPLGSADSRAAEPQPVAQSVERIEQVEGVLDDVDEGVG